MVCVGIKKILFIIVFHFFLCSCIAPNQIKSRLPSVSKIKLNEEKYKLIEKQFNLLPRENQQKILNHYIEKNNIIVYPLKRKRNLI